MEAQQPTLELSTELKPGKVVAGFRLGKQIGFGGFAKVFTAEHVDTRRKAAVKCVRKPKMKTRTSDRKPTTYKQPSPSEVNLLRTYNECRVLELLSHDNIVGLIDWVETKRHVYIITELAEDGDLLEYIRLFGPLSEKQLCNVFVSLVDALRYAHSHGFAHLDLKPENVLLNDDRVLLADWGFATPVKTTPSHLRWVGTRGYAAPEVVNQDLDHFDARRADCWSLGVTLYALACGKMAFDTRRPDVERLITSGEYAMPEHLPAPLRAVIAGLLKVDPAKRLTLTQLRASELYALATPPPAPRKSRTAAARSLPRSRVITTPVANTPIALAVPHTPDGSESDALPAPPPSREGQGLRDLPARPALLYGHALDEALIELDVLAEDDLPPEVAADERKALRKLEKQLEKDQRKFAEPSEAGAKLGSVLGLARRLMGMSNPKKERR